MERGIVPDEQTLDESMRGEYWRRVKRESVNVRSALNLRDVVSPIDITRLEKHQDVETHLQDTVSNPPPALVDRRGDQTLHPALAIPHTVGSVVKHISFDFSLLVRERGSDGKSKRFVDESLGGVVLMAVVVIGRSCRSRARRVGGGGGP